MLCNWCGEGVKEEVTVVEEEKSSVVHHFPSWIYGIALFLPSLLCLPSWPCCEVGGGEEGEMILSEVAH